MNRFASLLDSMGYFEPELSRQEQKAIILYDQLVNRRIGDE